MTLTTADRDTLLWIARESIVLRLSGTAALAVPREGALGATRGAFVTLRRLGVLRGCIGHTEADRALAEVVARCALCAAFADPRFPPVRAEDLPVLSVEISVLSGLESISDPEEIEIGRHGLVAELGRRRGLLLPKVPLECGWDRETFLRQTCVKAGLDPEAWTRGARLWRFEAEVFAEPEVHGLA